MSMGSLALMIHDQRILNINSASIPAWQASRINPVEAINNK